MTISEYLEEISYPEWCRIRIRAAEAFLDHKMRLTYDTLYERHFPRSTVRISLVKRAMEVRCGVLRYDEYT